MVHHFKWRGGKNSKDFPIQKEERDVYKWEEKQAVPNDQKKKFLLCNMKDKNKMVICYTILDPEFFILITPNY